MDNLIVFFDDAAFEEEYADAYVDENIDYYEDD